MFSFATNKFHGIFSFLLVSAQGCEKLQESKHSWHNVNRKSRSRHCLFSEL
jgi:hypothetical protein